jgi:CheY-like chemotaxis protein
MSQEKSIQRPNCSALVVDKDEAVRAMIRAILSRFGFRVIETADGWQAMSVVGEMPCLDLLVTDADPPGLNGTKLAESFLQRCPMSRAILTSSSLGGGAEDGGAWIFVPKQQVAEVLLATLRALGMAPAQQTVLLAEDEPAIRKMAALVLTRAGYSVLSASNGMEALEILSDYKAVIDLVISDIVMPGMKGTELARRIRQERPEARILLMSGHDFGLIREEPTCEFLAKPFTPQTLVERVGQVLGARPGVSAKFGESDSASGLQM